MKKLFILVTALFIGAQLFAQSPINFSVVNSSRNELSDEVKETLKLKIEQILGRQNAGANSMYNAFVIEPFIMITEQKTTQGQMRNVTLTNAELTLIAKNLYDGSIYQTSVTEISSQVNGAGDAALKNLIRNINVNNAAFTRFIRTSRERIIEHYNANCETILLKARTMVNMQQIDDAIGYLSSVPEVVPCYEKAVEMLEEAFNKSKTTECDQQLLLAHSKYVMKDYHTALEILAKIPNESQCGQAARALTDSIESRIGDSPFIIRDTVVVTNEVRIETVVPAPAPATTTTPATPAETPKEIKKTYKYEVSCLDLDFNVVSCTGYQKSKSIEIVGKIVNKGKTGIYYVRPMDVIDEMGRSYGRGSYQNINMPTGVEVRYSFEIKDITHKIDKFSYVEINMRDCTVTLRDLYIDWK